MRLNCDCGNELEFEESEANHIFTDSIHVPQNRDKFEITSDDFEVEIVCKNCSKNIHLFA